MQTKIDLNSIGITHIRTSNHGKNAVILDGKTLLPKGVESHELARSLLQKAKEIVMREGISCPNVYLSEKDINKAVNAEQKAITNTLKI